jgi:hypothetical protein
VTSWFAEIWGERLFRYTKHPNSNYPGSDASIDLGAMGPFEISVRSLTNAGISGCRGGYQGLSKTDFHPT